MPLTVRVQTVVTPEASVVAKIEAIAPELIVFPFKRTAEALLGKFDGNGFLDDRRVIWARLFVMPGPYARTSEVEARLGDLRTWAQAHDR